MQSRPAELNAKIALAHFPRSGARQFTDDTQTLRSLLPRNARCGEVHLHGREVEYGTALEHDNGTHLLAVARVVLGHHGDVAYRRVGSKHALDFLRRDVLAATDHDVLLAVGDRQAVRCIEPAN